MSTPFLNQIRSTAGAVPVLNKKGNLPAVSLCMLCTAIACCRGADHAESEGDTICEWASP